MPMPKLSPAQAEALHSCVLNTAPGTQPNKVHGASPTLAALQRHGLVGSDGDYWARPITDAGISWVSSYHAELYGESIDQARERLALERQAERDQAERERLQRMQRAARIAEQLRQDLPGNEHLAEQVAGIYERREVQSITISLSDWERLLGLDSATERSQDSSALGELIS